MDRPTKLFQQLRPRLLGLAYRMLGTPADAEDVLHDAWLRWYAQDTHSLDDPEAWLFTVTTRLALDKLRHAKIERAHYTGPWLPEPITESNDRPDAQVERSETLTLSYLLLLERLSAEERAAFLLHEIFDYSHAEAATILGIAEDASRQRTHRAKQRLREDRPRFSHAPETQRRLLSTFMDVLGKPTPDALRALFAEDALHLSDGGGVVRASLRPLHGVARLTLLYLTLARHYIEKGATHRLHWLNGAPAMLTWIDTDLVSATWLETDSEQIVAIHTLRHPEKLARIKNLLSSCHVSDACRVLGISG